MNVYPTNLTPAGATLTCLSGLAWALAIAVVVLNLADVRMVLIIVGVGVAAACTAAVVESTSKLLRRIDNHADRMEKSTNNHAARIEKATSEHAEALKQHVLALDRVFELGLNSDRLARLDAEGLWPWSPSGTGPFRVYNGGDTG